MKIESMFFDMDGTLVDYPNEPFHSSWDALIGALPESLKEQWKSLTQFYYPKRELYIEWYKKEVALLKGIKLSEVGKCLFPIPYSSGVKEFFSSRNGYVTGIVSAGVGLVAEKAAQELGLDFVVSNPLEIREGVFTGEGKSFINLWRKDLDILRIVRKNNLDLQRMIYVGDNENDIPAFSVVGTSVAFRPKNHHTEKAAQFVINDFRELNDVLKEIQK